VKAGVVFALAVCGLAGCGAPRAERAGGEVARAVEASIASGREAVDHSAWDGLLAAAVRGGLVDYSILRDRRSSLDAYLDRLAVARLETLAPGQLKALLINAYNAFTVKSILDRPQVSSIRQIRGVWTSKKHRVGGFDLTLDDIEHRILRPYFRDPRIHFALNCASRSCPVLPPRAYDGARLDAQLDERAKAFLADPGHVRVEAGRLLVSRIFEWYADDFTAPGWRGATPGIEAYIAHQAPPEVARFITGHGGKPPTAFLDYDWSLNQADPVVPAPFAPNRTGP